MGSQDEEAPRVRRKVTVSIRYLESVLRGELRQVIATNAPADLQIEGGRFRIVHSLAKATEIEFDVSSSAWPEGCGEVFTPVYHDGGPVRLTTKPGSGGLDFPL